MLGVHSHGPNDGPNQILSAAQWADPGSGGMAVSNYQKYELGAREPLEKNLPALADALGCSAYSLQESDKERFIRIYNKFVREAAMHRWDSYTFNAEEFLAYDIGEDIILCRVF